jgi:ketosteroid isomerase-like protein
MSAENVEVMRGALQAFAAQDVEALVGFMAPEIEFEPHLAGVEGNYTGHDGIREFMADAFETLEVVGMRQRDIRDLGHRVLALGTFQIHGRGSGIDDAVPFAIVASYRDGRCTHLKDYGEWGQALEAAGISE